MRKRKKKEPKRPGDYLNGAFKHSKSYLNTNLSNMKN